MYAELINAIAKRDLSGIRKFSAELEDIDEPNYLGVTALLFSVREDYVDGTREILQCGANPNKRLVVRSPVSGRIDVGVVPLMYAESLEMVKALVDFGASFDPIDSNGLSVLSRIRQNDPDLAAAAREMIGSV